MTPLFAGNGNVGTELNNGGAGESNVALRNLSTLVLLNGRRVANSPVSNGQAVDLNTIPQALIESIEIITGGAGAAYGADAIAGVVFARGVSACVKRRPSAARRSRFGVVARA